MFYGRKCKIFKAVMPIKSYHKKLNFVKNSANFGHFIAVFAIKSINLKLRFFSCLKKNLNA